MASARSIVARDDTLLGVCFALGEDFGFNPLYLRILFALVIFWSPTAAVAAYAVLGAVARVDTSVMTELVITDSICLGEAATDSSKIRLLTIAPLIGEAIKRIADESSVSSLFD